jgi:O-antigen ligase
LFVECNLTEIVILVGFLLWGLYALVSLRSGNNIIQVVPYWNWLGLFFLGAILAFFMGAFFNSEVDFDAERAFIFLRSIFLISFLLYILSIQSIRTTKDSESIMMAFLLGAILMALVVLKGDRPEASTIGPALTEDTRSEYMGLFALPFGLTLSVGGNSAATFFAMAGLLSFSLWLNGSLRWQRFVGFFAFLFASVMVIVMSTRGIWVSMTLGLTVIIFLSIKRHRVSLLRCFINLLITLGVIVIIYSLTNLKDIQYRIESLLHRDLLQLDEAAMYRFEQYFKLGKVFVRNPLGVGGKIFYTQEAISPHSLYLKLALMTGIIGLISYPIFLFMLMRYWYVTLPFLAQGHWIVIGAISIVILIFTFGLTGDTIVRFYLNTSFMLICGLTTALVRANRKKNGKLI